MENSKRKRGISLVNQRNGNAQVDSLNASDYTKETYTTRINYSRYHMTTDSSRHASMPKPKIQFSYPTTYTSFPHHEVRVIENTPIIYKRPESGRAVESNAINYKRVEIPIPRAMENTPAIYRRPEIVRQNVSIIESLPAIPSQNQISFEVKPSKEIMKQASPFLDFKLYENKVQNVIENKVSHFEQVPIEIPQKYRSFEDCKEKISKKLFKKEETKDQSTKIDLLKSQPSVKQADNINSQVSFEMKQNVCQPFSCEKKPNLEIQREVLHYSAESANVSNPLREKNSNEMKAEQSQRKQEISKKKKNRGRDMGKFLQMQKRLMEIIKICDQNL